MVTNRKQILTKLMNRFTLWALFGSLSGLGMILGCSSYAPRPGDEFISHPPSYSGLSLAQPRPFEGQLAPKTNYWTYKASLLKALLKVDAKGRVRQIEIDWSDQPSIPNRHGSDSPPDWANSQRWQSYDSLLRAIEFIPGRRNGKWVAQRIPVLITDNPRNEQVELRFPIDTAGRVDDGDLYWSAVQLNGGLLPRIESFPSYFLMVDRADTSNELDYMLIKLAFDTGGSVQRIELLHSDAGQFTSEILSAANWADYSVDPSANSKLADSAYLFVALYNLSGYPTVTVAPPLDSLKIPDQNRLRIVPDTIGLMFKPMPTFIPESGFYSISGERLETADSLSVLISIGKSGQITSFNPIGVSTNQLTAYLKLAARLKFFPALDFNGTPQPFQGVIRLEYQAGTILRIKFCWLPGQCDCYSF